MQFSHVLRRVQSNNYTSELWKRLPDIYSKRFVNKNYEISIVGIAVLWIIRFLVPCFSSEAVLQDMLKNNPNKKLVSAEIQGANNVETIKNYNYLHLNVFRNFGYWDYILSLLLWS